MMSRPVVVSPVKATLATRGLWASGLPGLDAEALHHVDHAARQDVGDELHDRHDRHRRLLGRLEHDAVPGGERRRQLPGRHQEREVPRDDLRRRRRAARGSGRRRCRRRARRCRLPGPGWHRRSSGSGRWRAAGRRDRLADRLAVVDRLDERDGLEILLEPVSDPVEDVGPEGGRGGVPAQGGGVGGIERAVDVLVGGAGDLAEGLAGDRRRVGEVLAAQPARRTHRRMLAGRRRPPTWYVSSLLRILRHGRSLRWPPSALSTSSRSGWARRAPTPSARGGPRSERCAAGGSWASSTPSRRSRSTSTARSRRPAGDT